MGPLTNITHYSPHIIHIGFSQKYSPYCYHIEPQNYTISIKSPKALTLWENPKAQQNPLQSSLLYRTLTKPVTTRHPKARCYTTLLQISLLHSTLKPIATRYSYKARCCMTPLQSPLLHDTLTKPVATRHPYKACCHTAIFFTKSYKAQMLIWHYFTKSKY